MSDTPTSDNSAGQGGQWPSASQPPAASPDNSTLYLILSALQLLCCNTIFGVISLVLSIQAKSAYDRGNPDEANGKLKTAKTILIIGLVIGILAWIGIIALFAVGSDDTTSIDTQSY